MAQMLRELNPARRDANAHAKGFGSDAYQEKLCGNITGFLYFKVHVEISPD